MQIRISLKVFFLKLFLILVDWNKATEMVRNTRNMNNEKHSFLKKWNLDRCLYIYASYGFLTRAQIRRSWTTHVDQNSAPKRSCPRSTLYMSFLKDTECKVDSSMISNETSIIRVNTNKLTYNSVCPVLAKTMILLMYYILFCFFNIKLSLHVRVGGSNRSLQT